MTNKTMQRITLMSTLYYIEPIRLCRNAKYNICPIAQRIMMCYNTDAMKHTAEFRTNIVLVFIRARHQSQRMKLNGIYLSAINRGWQIQPVDATFDTNHAKELINVWHPIGCLIDTSAYPPDGFRKADLPRIPIVFLGRDITGLWRRHDCATQNTRAPAVAAARAFRSLGLRNFSYVGDASRSFWSTERGQHFARAVRSWSFCPYENVGNETHDTIEELASHLASLSKPFGVLLAADHIGGVFYAAVKKAGLTIGKDVFVIGVDDDEMICKSLSPPLSSVRLDFTKAGRDAIELLSQRLDSPTSRPKCLTYGTFGVINRASSTKLLADSRLNRGVSFIKEHGCESIRSEDVVREMKCSRRLAEILIKRHLNKTILDCIRESRLEKAKYLLEHTDHAIDAIPSMCGYESLSHMKTYFRQQTGITMRDWRKLRRNDKSPSRHKT